jgi:hypothetical protein
MAAGLGFKTFTTGEVLTAADTNGYLMQGVLVFASAAARDAAITSPQEGQCCYLKDTDAVLTYSGAAWVGFDDSNAIQNSIVDAKGDLITATADNTPARLAVGATNGMTLQVDSTTATGLKWAAASSGALTLIKRASFSNVATTGTTFDSVFSSTYTNYLVIVEGWFNVGGSGNDDPQIQFMYSGSTQATGYYGGSWGIGYASATLRTVLTNNATQMNIWDSSGISENSSNNLNFYVTNVGNSSEQGYMWGGGINTFQNEQFSFGNASTVGRTYTGLLFKESAGNASGIVTIYGLANA